jgi:hypothetical protein
MKTTTLESIMGTGRSNAMKDRIHYGVNPANDMESPGLKHPSLTTENRIAECGMQCWETIEDVPDITSLRARAMMGQRRVSGRMKGPTMLPQCTRRSTEKTATDGADQLQTQRRRV